MKVKELIEKLKKMNPEYEVLVAIDEHAEYGADVLSIGTDGNCICFINPSLDADDEIFI